MFSKLYIFYWGVRRRWGNVLCKIGSSPFSQEGMILTRSASVQVSNVSTTSTMHNDNAWQCKMSAARHNDNAWQCKECTVLLEWCQSNNVGAGGEGVMYQVLPGNSEWEDGSWGCAGCSAGVGGWSTYQSAVAWVCLWWMHQRRSRRRWVSRQRSTALCSSKVPPVSTTWWHVIMSPLMMNWLEFLDAFALAKMMRNSASSLGSEVALAKKPLGALSYWIMSLQDARTTPKRRNPNNPDGLVAWLQR